jgi:hypothetical protein
LLTIYFSDCDYNKTVIVPVGPEEQSFSVYKDIICASSKFFKAACSERWIEGKEKKVRLPEVKPSVFQGYLAWLCSGIYQLQVKQDDPLPVISSAIEMAVELYLLGDVLDDIRFRNKLMETLACVDLPYFPQPTTLCMLWNRTPPTSVIRKMYVEKFILAASRESMTKNIGEYPAELVQQIAVHSLYRIETVTRKLFDTKMASFLEPVSEDD